MDGQRFEYQRGQETSLFSKRSGPVLGPTQPSTQSKPEISNRGVNWSGREADHSPPSSADVDEWSCTSAPPTCLYGAHRIIFTFTFTFTFTFQPKRTPDDCGYIPVILKVCNRDLRYLIQR